MKKISLMKDRRIMMEIVKEKPQCLTIDFKRKRLFRNLRKLTHWEMSSKVGGNIAEFSSKILENCIN